MLKLTETALNISQLEDDSLFEFYNDTNYNSSTASPVTDVNMDYNPYSGPWWKNVLYCLPFACMWAIAIGGNLIVIWIVLANKRMRTVTNYFLVNLAVADVMVSVINMFCLVYLLSGSWPFGEIFCRIVLFLVQGTISVSVLTFMAIAVDRYLAIMHPMRPKMTSDMVVAVIVSVWLLSIVATVPHLIYGNIHTFDKPSRTICFLKWPDGVRSVTDLAYSSFLLAINYFVPLIVLSVAYIIVGMKLWRSETIGEHIPRQEESVRSKRKIVKMMIMIVVIFAICWLPYHVYFILTSTKLEKKIDRMPGIQHIYLVIYWLAMSNSMYNPIIYCWMNARFRRGFKYVFRWCPCVNWHLAEPGSMSSGVYVRQSWSATESSKLDRHNSMMKAMAENLDNSCRSGCPCTGGVTDSSSAMADNAL